MEGRTQVHTRHGLANTEGQTTRRQNDAACEVRTARVRTSKLHRFTSGRHDAQSMTKPCRLLTCFAPSTAIALHIRAWEPPMGAHIWSVLSLAARLKTLQMRAHAHGTKMHMVLNTLVAHGVRADHVFCAGGTGPKTTPNNGGTQRALRQMGVYPGMPQLVKTSCGRTQNATYEAPLRQQRLATSQYE